MDYSMQIDNSDIQSLLAKLKDEEQKYENISALKKDVENIFSVIFFTQNIESIENKLFNVCVKVCDTFDELQCFELSNNCTDINNKTSIYVIQLFVSNIFQNLNNKWFANIHLESEHFNVCKTIQLPNLIPSDVYNIAVPFPKLTDPVTIKSYLFSRPEDSYWPIIKLPAITTDISYHFIPLCEHQMYKSKHQCDLYKIGKLYNKNIKLIHKKPVFKYQLRCKSQIKHLFESLLKNCIHKFDVDNIQTVVSNPDDVTLQLHVVNCDSSLSIDTKSGLLSISGTAEIVYKIKQIIYCTEEEENNDTCEDFEVDSSFFLKTQTLRTRLHEERFKKEINLEKIMLLYEEYKNLVLELSI